MSDFKPCPFCGGKPSMSYYQEECDMYCMECSKCSACIWADDDDEAMEKWNTRAADAQVEKMVALLRYIYSNHTKPGSDADSRIDAALAAYDAEKQMVRVVK